MKPKTTEWCGECEREVKIAAEMRVQPCPNCGEDLFPCLLCHDLNKSPSCSSCSATKLEKAFEANRKKKEVI